MPIDYSKYPPNWKDLRKNVLMRANNKCEVCGVENYSIVKRTYPNGVEKNVKIILTIAHLDHDETNWDIKIERLKAMCQQCHLRYDVKEKKRRWKQQNEDFEKNRTATAMCSADKIAQNLIRSRNLWI